MYDGNEAIFCVDMEGRLQCIWELAYKIIGKRDFFSLIELYRVALNICRNARYFLMQLSLLYIVVVMECMITSVISGDSMIKFTRAIVTKHIIQLIILCLDYHANSLGGEWYHETFQGEVVCYGQILVEFRNRRRLHNKQDLRDFGLHGVGVEVRNFYI